MTAAPGKAEVTRMNRLVVAAALLAFALPSAQAEIVRRTTNDGQLVLEDIPEVPRSVVEDLNRYQNVRSAGVLAWSADGRSLYVSTRFGEVSQIHRVDMPAGARTQLTFFDEPVGGASRQPQGSQLLFSMDVGGSEFAQLFLLDPADGGSRMLTDGKSLNGSTVWDRTGRRIAYLSTRRNGASNDVWMMDVDRPDAARLVLEAPDRTSWSPADFDAAGAKLLVRNYVSVTDSRIHLLDLASGRYRLLAGGKHGGGSNSAIAFDQDGKGFWLVTDGGGEFRRLAWQSLVPGSRPVVLTAGIPWNVESVAFSEDRRRGAFTVNEEGLDRLYLLDPATRRFSAVAGLPTGLVGGLEFSPDGRRLAMTLNTPRTPSDAFVLELADDPLQHGALTRWTFSEVGGLDTSTFVEPGLVRFESFDGLSVPAWVYKPPGKGPFPVVVTIHGGPEGQARPGFSSTIQLWVQKLGIAVVAPNVRGSDGYGRTYLGLDDGFRREDSVRDIGALLDWIGRQPDLDAKRVAVYGGSYGGYMVLASAVHYSDRLRAAVDVVGISNFVTFLTNTQDYRRDLRRAEYGDERDPKMREHLERISPLNNVARMAVPMLVVQGQNDPRVPVTESDQMVAALRAQGKPVWYMNALNEGHGYRKKENADVFQQVVVLFLQQHLL
jgi:dipeptidyl aminopeptidase/acylaminoacyl peptidase